MTNPKPMIDKLRASEEKNLFLVPEMPTPNGRTHLGHISGPYLKLDVLKRKAKRNGADAFLVSGADVYESYVERKAFETGWDEEKVCSHFYDQILKDFDAINIDFDLFINPLETEYFNKFVAKHQTMFHELIDSGSIVQVNEQIPFDKQKERYLTGCWIEGECSVCGTPTGSYLCENCGTNYKPEDIYDQLNYPSAQLLAKESAFLKLDRNEITKYLKKSGVSNSFLQIVEKYFDTQGEIVRVSTRQKTGISVNGSDDQEVLYTYTSLWFFSVFCADLIQEKFGLDTHPFAEESTFQTVTSFGIDNAIPYLCGVLGAGLKSNSYEAFDYLLPNFFYNLNGKKFSTSRLHVIWAGDIVNKGEISSDLVRFYLALRNPDREATNFDPEDFIQVSNNLCSSINRTCNQFNDVRIQESEGFPERWIDAFSGILEQQNRFLSLTEFQFDGFGQTINEWLLFFESENVSPKSSEGVWWLKAFAFIIYPLMPELGIEIYEKVTRQKSIRLEQFFSEGVESNFKIRENMLNTVSKENLDVCMNLN